MEESSEVACFGTLVVNCYGLLKREEWESSAKLHSSNSAPDPYVLFALKYITSSVSWGQGHSWGEENPVSIEVLKEQVRFD